MPIAVEEEKRDRPISVLFTPGEAEELRQLCWRARTPMSGWMREVILTAATKLERQLARDRQAVSGDDAA